MEVVRVIVPLTVRMFQFDAVVPNGNMRMGASARGKFGYQEGRFNGGVASEICELS